MKQNSHLHTENTRVAQSAGQEVNSEDYWLVWFLQKMMKIFQLAQKPL